MNESIDRLILTEAVGAVACLRLNRPEVLNALSPELTRELAEALEAADNDPAIRCIVLTGNDKAFAAGADIKQMAQASAVEMLCQDMIATWDRVAKIKKPIIAAISGFCLGGGLEIALMCDILIASDTAQFGQPEVNIGVIPGAGGSQRLLRALGKTRTMELILTGRRFSAKEACDWGLVNQVLPVAETLPRAMALAAEIAQKPPLAIALAKQAILNGLETGLSPSLDYERKLFYLLFASADQKEGMAAFLEKRPPAFKGA